MNSIKSLLHKKSSTVPYQTLTHYTDKAGYDGIMSSGEIRASVADGNKHTHYGKGVYFSPLDNADIGILPPSEAMDRLFSKVTPDAVEKMQYFISVQVDANWYAMPAMDPKRYFEVQDIWLVAQETKLDIRGKIVAHGETAVKQYFDVFRSNRHGDMKSLYKQYADELTEERRQRLKASSSKDRRDHSPEDRARRKTALVYIDGSHKSATLVEESEDHWVLEHVH